ncbi:MAG: hypothetical protein F6K56_37970, partial [Moorea sp. SIO3G5]|nr:hypothetical protein [Moorena sp. SIO3G5]
PNYRRFKQPLISTAFFLAIRYTGFFTSYLLPAPCSLLPAPCSLLPKTQ